MAIKIVSDIHGEYEAMRQQLNPRDVVVMLGDYLNLIDFRTLGGILAQVYSREEIIAALSALAKGDREVAGKAIRQIVSSGDNKPRKVRDLMRESYSEFFASIPCKAYMIYGNTDSPEMMRELAPSNIEIVEAGVFDLQGLRFGLVSGSPFGPWTVGLPGEIEPERYRNLVESIEAVDVLCTHCPPAIPDLTFDTVANRDEVGSISLLEYVETYKPSYHYFGHVHNPRASSFERGGTRFINAGFFKERRKVIVHSA